MQPTHSRPIEDPDKPFYIELLDGRDNFLTFARENNYEFSSLRRSFYSTSHLISELLLQYQESLTCNECGQQIISDYHRYIFCFDFAFADSFKIVFRFLGHIIIVYAIFSLLIKFHMYVSKR